MGEYTNAVNNLLDAIQLTTNSSIKKAEYDKTIQAQVLSCQDETIGKYRCRYQDAVIYAYASAPDMTFTNGAYVYILVPNGNMSNEKTILGTTQKLGINYISQAVGDQAYNIVGNNAVTSNNKIYLNTNNINYKRTIYQYGSTSQVTLDVTALEQYIKQSSSLIVGATFKTSIPPERQTRGHYGITYNLRFLDNTSNKQVIRSYTVDEDNMIDNPYRLVYETRQYQIFDVDGPNFIRVESIQIFNEGFPNATGTETSAKLNSGDIEITKLQILGAIRMIESEINGVAITFYTPQGAYFIADAPAGSTKTITAQVRVKGKLVSSAQKIPFYWGIENVGITPRSEYYNKYLGRGWKCLNEGNVVSYGTSAPVSIVEWVPGKQTFNFKLSDATARNNKLRVAIVYNGNVITKEINIQNLGASIPTLTIQSSGGTKFYYDIGHPTLTCKVNGTEPPSNYNCYWAYENNVGTLESLPSSGSLNDQYNNLVTELNQKKQAIAAGSDFPNALKNRIAQLEASIKEFNYIQRVEHNKIHDVQINNITKFGIFKCSVYNASGVYLGTASITLTNSLDGEDLYSLIINNGSAIYQYNENGIAPNSKSLDVPQQIQGLSFTIYDNLGNEIDNNIILNDSKSKIRWYFPIKDTLLVDQSSNGQSAGTDPTQSYKYYDNRLNLVYNIAQKYDIKKQRNQIKLNINYKGMNLTAETDFTFAKQGQPGTNGTQYLVKLVPNTTMNNPPLWPMITKAGNSYILNYGLGSAASESTLTISYSYLFFKAQLWRSGELVWQGNSISDTAKDNLTKPTAVIWSMLANKYSSSSSDASNFTVTNANNGAIRYDENNTLVNYFTTPYANIVKCSITWQGKTYYGTLPIITAWTSSTDYRINLKDYTGWRYAIYTSDGVLPQYDSSHPFEFIMSEKINNIWEDVSLVAGSHAVTFDPPVAIGSPTPVDGKKLIEILGITSTGAEDTNSTYRRGCTKNQWQARPVSRYDGVCVNAAITQVCKRNGNIIGRIKIPIHFLLNKFGLSHINEWDGNSVQVDTNGGFILSPQVGAGQKDSNNRFTGVLMGAVRDPGKTKVNTGLLGYASGDRTFFLNSENGSALFGKAGAGQVTIDPSTNRALIYSGNFWRNYNGETGLPSYGSNTGDNFYKNYRIGSTANPYGANVTNTYGQGMIIDLSSPQIYFGKGNFCVDKDGKLYAKNAVIEGKIIATELDLGSNTIPWGKVSGKPEEISYMQGYFANGTLHKGAAPSASTKGFSVDTNGLLQASNAVIWGEIYASKGTFAGSITANYGTIGNATNKISIGANGNNSSLQFGKTKYSDTVNGFYLGTDGMSFGKNNVFKVDASGNLTVKGDIIATSLNLNGNKLSYTNDIDDTTKPNLSIYFHNGKLMKMGTNDPAAGKNAFTVSTDGILQASNAVIWGTIHATAGQVGGWTIKTNGIRYGEVGATTNGSIALMREDFTRVIGGTSRSSLRFAIGGNFGVQTNGTVYASNVDLTGTITANKGKIGGWTISETSNISELYSKKGVVKLGLRSSWTQETNNKFIYVDDDNDGLLFYINAIGAQYLKQLKVERPKGSLVGTSSIVLGDAGGGSGAFDGGIQLKNSKTGEYVIIIPGMIEICSLNSSGVLKTKSYYGY